MATIAVTNVQLLPGSANPAPIREKIRLGIDIHARCGLPADEDLTWKVTLVGSPLDARMDQTLADICVGPVRKGRLRIPIDCEPVDTTKIPPGEALGVTLLLVTGSYDIQNPKNRSKLGPAAGSSSANTENASSTEFIRIGYYVNCEYSVDQPALRENPPAVPQWEHITRHILLEKPRIMRFRIDWGKLPDDGLGTSLSSDVVAPSAATGGMFGSLSSFSGNSQAASSGPDHGRLAALVAGTQRPNSSSSPAAAVAAVAAGGSAAGSGSSLALLDLKTVVLQRVLSFVGFVDVHTLCALRRVCRRFKEIIDAGGFMTHLRNKDDDGEPVPQAASDFIFAQLRSNSENVVSLDLERDEDGILTVESFPLLLAAAPRLRHLNISWATSLTDPAAVWKAIADQYGRGGALTAVYAAVRAESPPPAALLREIATLPDSFVGRLSALELSCAAEETAAVLMQILRADSLRTLNLPMASFGPATLDGLLANFPKLTHLGLELCDNLSPEVVSHLRAKGGKMTIKATHHPRDFEVDLEPCSRLTDSAREVADVAAQAIGGEANCDVTRVTIKPMDWPRGIQLRRVKNLLPAGWFEWPEDDRATCGFAGDVEKAEMAFRSAGFTEVGEADVFSDEEYCSDEDEEEQGEEDNDRVEADGSEDDDGSDGPVVNGAANGKRPANEDEPLQAPAEKRAKQ